MSTQAEGRFFAFDDFFEDINPLPKRSLEYRVNNSETAMAKPGRFRKCGYVTDKIADSFGATLSMFDEHCDTGSFFNLAAIGTRSTLS